MKIVELPKPKGGKWVGLSGLERVVCWICAGRIRVNCRGVQWVRSKHTQTRPDPFPSFYLLFKYFPQTKPISAHVTSHHAPAPAPPPTADHQRCNRPTKHLLMALFRLNLYHVAKHSCSAVLSVVCGYSVMTPVTNFRPWQPQSPYLYCIPLSWICFRPNLIWLWICFSWSREINWLLTRLGR